MKGKILFLLSLLISSVGNTFGQADPGSTGMTFDKTMFVENQTGTLRVYLGNYTAGVSAGKALAPFDATFTITIPPVLNVHGTIDFINAPFAINIASQTMNATGATIIVLTLPGGISKDVTGYITIPVIALKENMSILYATLHTAVNLGFPPSGDLVPGNNDQNAPVTVCTALPVTLASFEVTKENGTANLTWSTTEEVNSERFDVEHSQNGKHWNLIGSVASNGESKVKRNYNFTNKNPAGGNNYYRLKLIDKNTTYAYSSIRMIDFDEIKLEVYPNPVSDILTIGSGNWKAISNVQVINMNGAAVYNSGNTPSQIVNVKDLKTGIYVVKVTKIDGSIKAQKILVKR